VPPGADPAALVEGARTGDRRALARALSLVERGGDQARELGRRAFPHGGQTYTVGVTGPSGGGKSTLVGALVGEARRRDLAVAVLAVDPSSPFTGGAILGDRIRLQDHVLDPQVFIRSMATRGHPGGLALATPQAVRLLDAAGIPWVFLETVGVGQVEVEVAATADSTVVVLNPGWGDAVQASKAGLLEVADLFVVNKADREGTADTRRDLEGMLDLSPPRPWRPPVIETVATRGEGVDRLWKAIGEHREHLETDGELERRRRDRLVDELRAIVARCLERRAVDATGDAAFDRLRDRVVRRQLDPYAAAEEIVDRLGRTST
jgi:LAO/AO transport system kinase